MKKEEKLAVTLKKSEIENGSIFVEFDINMDSVKLGGNEKWGIISGPGSPLDKLNRKKGLEGIKEMPEVYNIEIKGEK